MHRAKVAGQFRWLHRDKGTANHCKNLRKRALDRQMQFFGKNTGS